MSQGGDIRTSQDKKMDESNESSISKERSALNKAQFHEDALEVMSGGREWIAPISHIIPDMAVLYNQEGFSRFISWDAAERRLSAATSYELVGLESIPDE